MIDRVRVQDNAQPFCCVSQPIGCGIGQRVKQAGVSCPPSHIAGSLVQIAIDQVDVYQCKVAKASSSNGDVDHAH